MEDIAVASQFLRINGNAGKKKKMAPRATSCKDIAVASQFLLINGKRDGRATNCALPRRAALDDDRITWSDSLPGHDAAQRQQHVRVPHDDGIEGRGTLPAGPRSEGPHRGRERGPRSR